MLNLLQREPQLGFLSLEALVAKPPVYRGAERRRSQPPAAAHWLALVLDELDYGLVVLDTDGRVLHANHAARTELAPGGPVSIEAERVATRRESDQATLAEALQAASQRGLRRLVNLGPTGQRCCLAVVPLPGSGGLSLLVMEKSQVCENLSVQWYARSHRLTRTESRVLEALCAGESPSDIAKRHVVGLSTVRSQIGSIRAKTETTSIRELVQKVAVLPPLVSALRSPLAHGTA